MGHGPVHWSANFDEIQDFENDIRFHFDGLGFMTEEDFQATSNPLGATKAGLSIELDALAAYVASFNTLPASPHRNSDGSVTADAVYGREIFARLNCASCHTGDNYTDSAPLVGHDVGTWKPTSGASLTHVDTPTLKGIWASPPYFHDGSAKTLGDAIEASGPLHGNIASLTGIEKQQLTAYLEQLETDDSNPGGPENSRDLSGYANWRQSQFGSTDSAVGAPENSVAKDGISNLLKYFAAEAPGIPGLGPVRGSTVDSGIPSSGDPRYLQLQVRMRKDSENLRYEVQSATKLNDWSTQVVQPLLLDGSDPDYDLIGLRIPFSNRPALFMRIEVRE
jgi:mono/diheme cytochrome c family protein